MNLQNKHWLPRSSQSETNEYSLDEIKNPVNVKEQKYRTELKKFLNRYVDELLDMGSLKSHPLASWQVADYVLLKDSKSKFWTTVDPRPVNSATRA